MPAVHRPAPDPERRTLVSRTFVDLYGRLELLLGDGWLGAWDEVERLAPALAAELEAAETRADETAREFIGQAIAGEPFRLAMAAYEGCWERAAAFLKALRAGLGRSPCAGCGRTDAVVTVLQDDGTFLCSRCFRCGGNR